MQVGTKHPGCFQGGPMGAVPGGQRKEGRGRLRTFCEAVLRPPLRAEQRCRSLWVSWGTLSPTLSGIFHPSASPHMLYPGHRPCCERRSGRNRSGEAGSSRLHRTSAWSPVALNRTWPFPEVALSRFLLLWSLGSLRGPGPLPTASSNPGHGLWHPQPLSSLTARFLPGPLSQTFHTLAWLHKVGLWEGREGRYECRSSGKGGKKAVNSTNGPL